MDNTTCNAPHDNIHSTLLGWLGCIDERRCRECGEVFWVHRDGRLVPNPWEELFPRKG